MVHSKAEQSSSGSMISTGATDDKTTSERVIDAVAEQEGVDPLDLEVPLFEAIDPDILETFDRTTDEDRAASSLRVGFTYYGYDVLVWADGSIDVSPEL